jgi:hypothetical protein
MSQLLYAQGKGIPKFEEHRYLDQLVTVLLSLFVIFFVVVVNQQFSQASRTTISNQSFLSTGQLKYFSQVSTEHNKSSGLEMVNEVRPAGTLNKSRPVDSMHHHRVTPGSVRKSISKNTSKLNKIKPQSGVLLLNERVPTKALLSAAEKTAGSSDQKALCPIDMQVGHLIENGMFGENPNYPFHNGFHEGIDIFGPRGVEVISPHVCRIESMRISSTGAHSVFLFCPDLEMPRVEFGHVDLTLNNYETLRWYGVSFAAFHHAEQTRAVYIDAPTQNLDFMQPGESTHVYMGNTGAKSVHLHLEIKQDKYAPPVDPCLVFDCCE